MSYLYNDDAAKEKAFQLYHGVGFEDPLDLAEMFSTDDERANDIDGDVIDVTAASYETFIAAPINATLYLIDAYGADYPFHVFATEEAANAFYASIPQEERTHHSAPQAVRRRRSLDPLDA